MSKFEQVNAELIKVGKNIKDSSGNIIAKNVSNEYMEMFIQAPELLAVLKQLKNAINNPYEQKTYWAIYDSILEKINK